MKSTAIIFAFWLLSVVAMASVMLSLPPLALIDLPWPGFLNGVIGLSFLLSTIWWVKGISPLALVRILRKGIQS